MRRTHRGNRAKKGAKRYEDKENSFEDPGFQEPHFSQGNAFPAVLGRRDEWNAASVVNRNVTESENGAKASDGRWYSLKPSGPITAPVMPVSQGWMADHSQDLEGCDTFSPRRIYSSDTSWNSPDSPDSPLSPVSPASTCSSTGQSPLASYLEGFATHHDSATALESCTASVADDVLLHMHALEKKDHVDPADMENKVNLVHRRKVIAWLVKVFDVVHFDDNILYGTVSLADAYIRATATPISGTGLQAVVMACLCTVLKLQSPESRSYPVPELLAHITHNQMPLDRVLKYERDVLIAVGFNVSSPTVAHFLETFCMRIGAARTTHQVVSTQDAMWHGLDVAMTPETLVGGPAVVRPKFYHLADYLCQLSLLNHALLKFVPSLIATGALFLSIWSLDGPVSLRLALAQDVLLIWNLKSPDHASQLTEVMHALHGEWACAPATGGAAEEKFRGPARHAVSDVAIPSTVPTIDELLH